MDRKPNSSYQRSGFPEDRDQKKETGFIEDEIWDQKGRRGEEGEGELSLGATDLDISCLHSLIYFFSSHFVLVSKRTFYSDERP